MGSAACSLRFFPMRRLSAIIVLVVLCVGAGAPALASLRTSGHACCPEMEKTHDCCPPEQDASAQPQIRGAERSCCPRQQLSTTAQRPSHERVQPVAIGAPRDPHPFLTEFAPLLGSQQNASPQHGRAPPASSADGQ